ncbi:hypothetical protein JQ621_28850 [Bradyrhizobium manausense]|uniref:hypothetical protein n=1 Tax=Bradyrhizobium manausense TaxID=989370 RepID=UPI001BA8DBE7|nr:hypothetical protein [Bradyrhizobium manausense]MBR1091486.1 hypothetical protein [Bradyrhizobium manausense]
MKHEQAVRINHHLLAAYKALDQARMAIAGLAKAERIELGDWLDEVVGVLEDELLQPIYDQYPDLEPPSPTGNHLGLSASSRGIRCSFRHR